MLGLEIFVILVEEYVVESIKHLASWARVRTSNLKLSWINAGDVRIPECHGIANSIENGYHIPKKVGIVHPPSSGVGSYVVNKLQKDYLPLIIECYSIF